MTNSSAGASTRATCGTARPSPPRPGNPASIPSAPATGRSSPSTIPTAMCGWSRRSRHGSPAGSRGCPRSRRTLSGGPPASSAPVGSVRGAKQVREDRRNRHEEGIRPEGRHDRGGVGESAPCGDSGGARRAGRGSEGGTARAERRCRAGCRARVDGARGRRGRGPEGQAQPGPDGEASRPRGRVDDVGRPARAGPSAADAHGRRRARAAGRELRVLRRPRPADAGGDGPDARRRLDPQVRAGRRAGRRGGRAGGHRRRRRPRCRSCSSSAPAPRWAS